MPGRMPAPTLPTPVAQGEASHLGFAGRLAAQTRGGGLLVTALLAHRSLTPGSNFAEKQLAKRSAFVELLMPVAIPRPGGYRVLNTSYLNWRKHADVRAY